MLENYAHFTFSSERIYYRPLQVSDFAQYYQLDSDPKVRAFFPNGALLDPDTVKANIARNIAFFKAHGFGTFIVSECHSQEFIGRCGFRQLPSGEIEVGYVFLKKFWGQGLATEALKTLLNWAKVHIHTVDNIVAYTSINHIASQKVMQKAGMRFYKYALMDNESCVFYALNLR